MLYKFKMNKIENNLNSYNTMMGGANIAAAGAASAAGAVPPGAVPPEVAAIAAVVEKFHLKSLLAPQ